MKGKDIVDSATLLYLKEIKKWMHCPACQKAKMVINKKTQMWECESCDFKLSTEEFENDYTFWFCDECDSFLNNQNNFDSSLSEHTCTKCGYKNPISTEHVRGICKNCGKILSNSENTMCTDCKHARNKKIQKAIGAGAIAVGAFAIEVLATVAVSALSKDSNSDNNSDDDNAEKRNDTIKKFRLIFEGEEQDELYNSYEQAEEAALELCSCSRTGAEILHMSNPGDYDYDENEEYDYDIDEV